MWGTIAITGQQRAGGAIHGECFQLAPQLGWDCPDQISTAFAPAVGVGEISAVGLGSAVENRTVSGNNGCADAAGAQVDSEHQR